RILWNSLVGDALDAYPEYTGTITQELLRAPDGRERSPDSLRAELARAGLRMTASLGFSDSYALGMKEDVAERLGIRTIS
ncbi:glycine betaine ABC transporter substrate-binding protein, partial [Acinetobacter baumannii]